MDGVRVIGRCGAFVGRTALSECARSRHGHDIGVRAPAASGRFAPVSKMAGPGWLGAGDGSLVPHDGVVLGEGDGVEERDEPHELEQAAYQLHRDRILRRAAADVSDGLLA